MVKKPEQPTFSLKRLLQTGGLKGCLAVSMCLLAAAPLNAQTAFEQCGKASWYKLTGMTASGERADPSGMTAAHRSLPFGTEVVVTNLRNGRIARVRINDRGPFTGGRIIDVTEAAAQKLGFIRAGVTRVRVTLAEEEESTGSSTGKPVCK